MLISFKVANFKSIRDEQELSMLPSRSNGDFDALPVAAIYGANASGKSTLLEALFTLRDLLPDSIFDITETGHFPFLLDDVSSHRPTSFELEIEVNGIRYEYALSSLEDHIQHEHLYSYPENRKRVLFDRNVESVKFGSTIKSRSTLKKVARDLNKNASVFRLAHSFSVEEFEPILDWIYQNLERNRNIDSPVHLGFQLERFPALRDLIRIADLGIERIDTVPVSIDDYVEKGLIDTLWRFAKEKWTQEERGIEKIEDSQHEYFNSNDFFRMVQHHVTEIVFYHTGSSAPFKVTDESRGTLAFLSYMAAILNALESGSVLLFDEFDTSLHPRLIPRIIELFKDKETNPKNAQLIFTTHDATLLGTSFGDPILERDEVWFVEKNDTGATELFPLTSFSPRKEHNLERGYLGGSYGAVPEIFAQSLVDVLKNREGVASRAEAENPPG